MFERFFADQVQSRSGVTGGVAYGERVDIPSSFLIEGVPAADYLLEVSRVSDGCYVESATYGRVEALGGIVNLVRVPTGRLRIALACDAGSLSVRVTDRDGNPVSNVRAFVMPASGSAAELAASLRTADVLSGQATIPSLRPGKYSVLAAGMEVDGTADVFLRLWHARSEAKQVEISPRSAAEITVHVTELQ